MEIWKQIVGFEGLYEISDLGRIKSLSRVIKREGNVTANYKEKIIHGWITDGYRRVTLSKGNDEFIFKVHRLVATHFIPNPFDKEFVNHKNGIKHDNRKDNLEWATASDNIIHAYENKMISRSKGLDSHMAKILVHKEIGVFATVGEVAKMENKSHGQMAAIIRNEYPNNTKWILT